MGAKVARRANWFKLDLRSCYYCGKRVKLTDFQPDSATIDHKIPLSCGGKTEKNNLVVACCLCNADKKSIHFDEYRALVAFRKNAVTIQPVRIFAGESWVPPKLPVLTYPRPEWRWQTAAQVAGVTITLWIVRKLNTLYIGG